MLSVYPVDARVECHGGPAVVLAVIVGQRGVLYEVGYWSGCEWKVVILPESELSGQAVKVVIGFK